MKEKDYISKPSFGKISILRAQGGNTSLFGSKIKHDHFIEIRVDHAEMREGDYKTDIQPTIPILQLRMTNVQFAEMITNLNTEGVPCTILRIGNETVKHDFEHVSTVQAENDRFQNLLKEGLERIIEVNNQIQPLFDKLPVKAQNEAKSKLKSALDSLYGKFKESVPFYFELFQEKVEKTVVEAKANIEAAAMHKIVVAGLESLKGTEEHKSIER